VRLFKLFSIAAVAASVMYCAVPAAAQSPAPASSPAVENPTVTTLARAQVEAFRAGKIDRTQYTADANTHLTDTLVSQVSQVLARGGAVRAFSYSGNSQQSGIAVAQYAVTFDKPIAIPEMPQLPTTADWLESIATDASGKISFLLFAPKM